MKSWFEVNKIDDLTYVISEPFHWEKTNSYLLIGKEKCALIDTGLGISNIRKIIDKLTNLPIIVLTSHGHWDHIGGHKYFNNIAIHEYEESWISGHFPIDLEEVKKEISKNNDIFPKNFYLSNYRIYDGGSNITIYDGKLIDLGNRLIKIIHTPGHSPGHCSFYDISNKYLFSGDLIYKGILYAYYPSTDPIKFYESILKVEKLKIDKIFPGHYEYNLSYNFISEIKRGFENIKNNGGLIQGRGVFNFSDFSIHI